jgi:drug/metabolite transporter (DMT)-like permease
MRVSTSLIFAAYTFFSVTGMLIVKRFTPELKSAWVVREGLLTPLIRVGGGALLYVLGFSLWMIILSRTPLTVAYPVAVGLTMVFSILGAAWLLGETLNAQTLFGSLLVFVGIVLLARR